MEKESAAEVRQYTHSAPPRGTASTYSRYVETPARPKPEKHKSARALEYASAVSRISFEAKTSASFASTSKISLAMPAPHQASAATSPYAAAPYAERGTPKSMEYPDESAVWHPVSGHVTAPPVSFSKAR
jgi:hypothetical protein